jgi:hypothetical protein
MKKPTKPKKASKVVDIKTRRGTSVSPSILRLAEQLIAMSDIRDIVAVLGDISNEGWSPQLIPDVPNTPEIQQRVHDIIYEAVWELDRFTDSLGQRRSMP